MDLAGGARIERSPYLRLLRNRNFLIVWLGQSISNLGDWIIVVPLLSFIYQLSHGSALATGSLMIFKILPALLFGSVIGVLVDRWDRKKTMVYADLIRAGLILILPFATSIYTVYLITFLMDTVSLTFVPAMNASVPNVVSKDEILEANSFLYTTSMVMMLVGIGSGSTILLIFSGFAGKVPVVSEILIGPKFAFYFDAGTFLASALTISLIHLKTSAHMLKAVDPAQLKNDIVEGARYLGSSAQIKMMIFSMGIALLGAGTIYGLGAPFADQVLGLTGNGLGVILTPFAAGTVLGVLGSNVLVRFFSKQAVFILSILLFGVALSIFAGFPSITVAILATGVAGFSQGVITIIGYTVIQEGVTDELRGRVFAAMESLARVSLLVSLVLSGVVADVIGRHASFAFDGFSVRLNGPQATLFLGGLVIIGAGVFALRYVRINGRVKATPLT